VTTTKVKSRTATLNWTAFATGLVNVYRNNALLKMVDVDAGSGNTMNGGIGGGTANTNNCTNSANVSPWIVGAFLARPFDARYIPLPPFCRMDP
jgi:hypothetical protein